MLKKINVDQLVIGMHIKEFCGSWMEHPFWRTQFTLAKQQDLDAIRNSSIKEIWIDNSKGLDVKSGEATISEAESEAQVDGELNHIASSARSTTPVSTERELIRAARICSLAKTATKTMFQEARMGNTVNTSSARKLVEEISDSLNRNPNALISLARLKTADNYTYMHSVAVCALMIALARQLGLDDDDVRSAGEAGLLHDLGKAVIPLKILNKPGKLTDKEFAQVKKHPEDGCHLLRESGASAITFDVVRHHHEKTDGSGYPDGLRDGEISLYARMGAVCDVYDAITSNRPYKAGWDPAESLRKMAEWVDGHFDPQVFQAFVKCVGIYPIGSLVKLQSGRLGVVMDQTPDSLLNPRVKVFYSTRSHTRINPVIIDLSKPQCEETIVSREDPAKWQFPGLNEMWAGPQGR